MNLAALGLAVALTAARYMPTPRVVGYWCWCGKRFAHRNERPTHWEEIIGCDTYPALKHLGLEVCGAAYFLDPLSGRRKSKREKAVK